MVMDGIEGFPRDDMAEGIGPEESGKQKPSRSIVQKEPGAQLNSWLFRSRYYGTSKGQECIETLWLHLGTTDVKAAGVVMPSLKTAAID